MKKYLALLLCIFLFGCTLSTPWGQFNMTPSEDLNLTGGQLPGGGGAATGPHEVFLQVPQGQGFLVEIDGIASMDFLQVGVVVGPGESVDPANASSLFLGNQSDGTPRDVVLKRSYTLSTDMDDWRKAVVQGNIERRNMQIILLDSNHEPTAYYQFVNTWPRGVHYEFSNVDYNATYIIASELADVEHP